MTPTKIREQGITFSAEMVRAILQWDKTMTRRVIHPQPASDMQQVVETGGGYVFAERVNRNKEGVFVSSDNCTNVLFPTYCVGDRLWVREAWRAMLAGPFPVIEYRADPDNVDPQTGRLWHKPRDADAAADWCSRNDAWGRWRSPRFMPRWASRITLEVVAVRPERLQDISEGDAKAEGVQPLTSPQMDALVRAVGARWRSLPYLVGFTSAWDRINGKKHPWKSNPWVWAYTFRMIGGEA